MGLPAAIWALYYSIIEEHSCGTNDNTETAQLNPSSASIGVGKRCSVALGARVLHSGFNFPSAQPVVNAVPSDVAFGGLSDGRVSVF